MVKIFRLKKSFVDEYTSHSMWSIASQISIFRRNLNRQNTVISSRQNNFAAINVPPRQRSLISVGIFTIGHFCWRPNKFVVTEKRDEILTAYRDLLTHKPWTRRSAYAFKPRVRTWIALFTRETAPFIHGSNNSPLPLVSRARSNRALKFPQTQWHSFTPACACLLEMTVEAGRSRQF